MSWFQTAKNVVKIVAERVFNVTNADVGGPLAASAIPDTHHDLWSVLNELTTSVNDADVGGPFTATAMPDTHHGLWSVLSEPTTSVNAAEESSDSESGTERQNNASGFTVGQVTTRARFTYELDSIDKGSYAVPYQSRAGTSRSGGNEADSDSDASEEARVGVARITTRARITYELDRYQKNLLLMFVQMRSEPLGCSRVHDTTTQDLNLLLDTLTGFRFEVNTNIDLTCSQIESTCQEFFQQDFGQYGAVIVVVLTFEGVTGQLSASDGRFSESIILRHFTDNLNPTLVAKPKIYITEANRIISSEHGPRLSIPLEDHQDVLGLHLPSIDHQAMVRRPISLLCHNIKEMADTHDFVTILKTSVEEIEKEAQSIFQDKPIELSINFTKEMMLARS